MARQLAFALVITATVPAFAVNPPYIFTPIVDSTGPFATFQIVAINNLGQVAIKATLDNSTTGVYFASKTSSPVPVALSGASVPGNGTISAFASELDINDSGAVVLGASTSTLASIVAIASTSTPLNVLSNNSASPGGFAINNSGVASLIVSGFNTSVITSNGATSATIATTSPSSGFFILNGLAGTSINNNGAVAFLAATAGGTGIYSNASGTVASLIDTSGAFNSFSSVAENSAGTIAFQGTMDDNSKGIFTVSSTGALATVVPANSSYFKIYSGFPAINDSGKVLFLAGDTSAHLGLYTGPDPSADKVAAIGDPLFGSTISSLATFSEGLNNSGQVAFRANLANGINYVVLATPAFFGDANTDGHVDLTDLSIVLNNFGAATTAWTSGNFDGAPTIDLTDLSYVLNNFGVSSPALAAAPGIAPEPASLLILSSGAMCCLYRRRALTGKS